MKFLYLVQTGSTLPENYSALRSDRSDVLSLTWKTPSTDGMFLPRSTWTEGRNALHAAAITRLHEYDYVVFLDDDITFVTGDWRSFEECIRRYKPAIGCPYLVGYPSATKLDLKVQTTYAFDACINAFHRSVLEAGNVLPYVDQFDSVSWWYSQMIVIHKAAVFYPRGVWQFNTVHVSNSHHGEYPQDREFAEARRVERWLRRRLVRHPFRTLARMRPFPKWAYAVKPRAVSFPQ